MLLCFPRSLYLKNKSHSTELPILVKALPASGSWRLGKTSVHPTECAHRNGQSSHQRSCQHLGAGCYLSPFTQAIRNLIAKSLKSFPKFFKAVYSEWPDANTPHSTPPPQPPRAHTASPSAHSRIRVSANIFQNKTGSCWRGCLSDANAIAKSEATGKVC